MPEEQIAAHLDDETLNAVLDAEAGAEEIDHARSCSECSPRLARLAAVAVAVSAPVDPPTAERRRAAVAHALTVGMQAGERSDPGDEQPSSGAAEPDLLTERRLRSRRRGAGWIAAAASVAALAMAVPLLNRSPASDSQDQATGSASELSDAAGDVAGDCPTCGSARTAFVDGGDLGDLDQPGLDALTETLGHEIATPAPPAQPESNAALAGPTERCATAARERDPDLGSLVYAARARYDGVDTVVLGFHPAGSDTTAPGRAVVFVLDAHNCTQLASA